MRDNTPVMECRVSHQNSRHEVSIMGAAQHERRRWPRYRTKPGTLLFNENIFAEIINISKGGALCVYLSAHGEDPPPMRQINLIDMKTKICFPAIPCADLNYRDPGADMPLAVLRTSHLKFILENQTMGEDLRRFIDGITADPV